MTPRAERFMLMYGASERRLWNDIDDAHDEAALTDEFLALTAGIQPYVLDDDSAARELRELEVRKGIYWGAPLAAPKEEK